MIGADPCTTGQHLKGVELDAKGFVVTRDGFATSVPDCSLSVTCAPGPSSGSRRRSARDPW